MAFRIIGFTSPRADRERLTLDGAGFHWIHDAGPISIDLGAFQGGLILEPSSVGMQNAALECIRTHWPHIPILVVSRFPLSDKAAVRNVEHLGLITNERLAAWIGERWGIAERLPVATSHSVWSENLIGGSSQTFQLLETIEIIADRKSTVLITGETGTGKEVVARAIHQRSNRSHRPMITVNCAALPETLLESELFGNTKGAFTGANAHRVGYVEKANRGTLFLDEIGDMPLETQAKLLRLLQEREFQRIGSPEPIPVDIRVIAATNVDLRRAIVEKRFRSDLFFRLNVIPINLSPLRERLSEIPQLVDHFIAKTCRHEGIVEKVADNDAISSLREYSWPGNVRQLEHAVEMAVVLSGQREVLTRKDFQAVLVAEDSLEVDPSLGEAQIPNDGMDFNHTLIVFQRALMDAAMRKAAGNQSRAAQLLGMKRTTMISRYKALSTAAAS